VCLGLYLFGEKYANPEEYAAFWVMIVFVIIYGTYEITFSIYNLLAKAFNEDWVKATEKEVEMKQVGAGDGGTSSGPPKKAPSPVSCNWFAILDYSIIKVLSFKLLCMCECIIVVLLVTLKYEMVLLIGS